MHRTASPEVVNVRGLSKRFGRTRAVDGLDLTVAAGEVHGFLGPNGSGKSTTLRVLLGLLRADSGATSVLGLDPWRDATGLHRRLAYVPGEVNLWPQLTGGEVIDLLGRLRGGASTARRNELLDQFGLDPTSRCGSYSHGNRQKVALVAAFSCEAELLVLDEPTSGLDPLVEEVFRDCVRAERSRGRTVLLSSHLLDEVDALCDQVTIVRAGRTVQHGRVAELRQAAETVVDVTLDVLPEDLDRIPGLSEVVVDGRRVRCRVATAKLGFFLGHLATYGIVTLTCQPPTLEQLFLRFYGPSPESLARGSQFMPSGSGGR